MTECVCVCLNIFTVDWHHFFAAASVLQMSKLLVQTDVSAAVLSLSPLSWTGRMAVVVRWSCSYIQSVQLARLTVWTPLFRPAVAGRHDNKALVDTDAEGGGGAE